MATYINFSTPTGAEQGSLKSPNGDVIPGGWNFNIPPNPSYPAGADVSCVLPSLGMLYPFAYGKWSVLVTGESFAYSRVTGYAAEPLPGLIASPALEYYSDGWDKHLFNESPLIYPPRDNSFSSYFLEIGDTLENPALVHQTENAIYPLPNSIQWLKYSPYGWYLTPCSQPPYQPDYEMQRAQTQIIDQAWRQWDLVTREQWVFWFEYRHVTQSYPRSGNMLPLYSGFMGMMGMLNSGGNGANAGGVMGLMAMAGAAAGLVGLTSAAASAGGRVPKTSENEDSFEYYGGAE